MNPLDQLMNAKAARDTVHRMNPLDQLMNAKAARDTVRDQLVKSIRRLPDPLTEDLLALLRADDLATEGLKIALTAYGQITDSPPTNPEVEVERNAA